MRPAFAGSADEAEERYLRMCRLRRMNPAQLREVLAGDPCEAAPWVEAAARYGVAEAQLRLGQMRLDGLGAPRDEACALAWFTRAASQGAPEAMNMVGRCYENGWGAPEDLARAALWYRKSAEAGCAWGDYNLANLLFDGRGVDRDLAQAVGWYRRAADQGHARAMNLLARCFEEGWGVARDEGRARDWYRRSAELGYFRAQYNHATRLAEDGLVEESFNWFEAACRAATADSLPAMLAGLVRHADRRIADLGERLAKTLAPQT